MRRHPRLKSNDLVAKRYKPRGAARELFLDSTLPKNHPRFNELLEQGLTFICGTEVLIEGPAGTGKTFAVLRLVYQLMNLFPGMRVLLTRETRASMTETVLVTWEEEVLGPGHYCMKRGGERKTRDKYVMRNGSEAIVLGMNNWKRIMSGEYDMVVYFEVVDEQDENKWAAMQTRLRHQSVPYPRGYADKRGNLLPEAWSQKLSRPIPASAKTIWDLKNRGWFGEGMPLAGGEWPDKTPIFWHLAVGDCNPGHPEHWANKRPERKIGNRPLMRRLKSVHADNPTITKDYKERLESLPPELRDRLAYGLWTAAEGAIYKAYRASVHQVPQDPSRQFSRYLGSIDWGFNDAGVFQVWGINHTGMYRVQEVYFTNQIADWWENVITDAVIKYKIERLVADPSRPGSIEAMNRRLSFARTNARVFPAENALLEGIDAVQYGLDPGMGLPPRIYFVQNAFPLGFDPELKRREKPVCTEQEISGYVWKTWRPGQSYKEAPAEGQADHGLDALRYAAMEVMVPGYLGEQSVGHTQEEAWVVRYYNDLVSAANSSRKGRRRRKHETPY